MSRRWSFFFVSVSYFFVFFFLLNMNHYGCRQNAWQKNIMRKMWNGDWNETFKYLAYTLDLHTIYFCCFCFSFRITFLNKARQNIKYFAANHHAPLCLKSILFFSLLFLFHFSLSISYKFRFNGRPFKMAFHLISIPSLISIIFKCVIKW